MKAVIVSTLLVGVSVGAAAQESLPRTAWGTPDLQGVWLYWTATPLERPEEFDDKAVVTAEEAADFVARRQDEGVTSGDWDSYTGLLNGRTSLLTDPPNGKLPARTEAGQQRAETIASRSARQFARGPEDRNQSERCLMGPSVPFHPEPWDQLIQIVQTADDLVIVDEQGDLRLVQLTEQPRLPASIGQWAGNSQGHWEGDTLVVDTTNFRIS